MTIYLGDFPTGKTIYVPFHTFNSSGASVTITGLAVTDIEVYRNGSVTQRASDAGYALLDTDGIDFDGLTGIHGFSIDTSDNTDAGFYAAGYDYWVVVSAITVDAQTVSFVAAIFSIDNRQLLRPTVASRTLDVSAGGEAGIDWANVGSPTTTLNLSGTSTKALEPTTAGRTLDVTATGEAGIDWANIGSPTTSVALSGTSVLLTSGTGTGQVSLASGRVNADTVYIAGTSLPANGPIPFFGIVDMGTAQSYDGATDKLRLRAAFSSPDIVGCWVWIYSSTNGLHTRGIVTAWDNTNKDATIDTPVQDPSGTILYVVVASPKSSTALPLPANMIQLGSDTQSATDLKDFADAGYDPATNKVQGVVTTDTATAVTTVNGLAANTITAASIAADAITAAKIADGAIDAATFAAGAITASAIAADAIGASELAADAVTEIVNGVLTTAMTEAYPTDGSTATVAQMLYLIAQSIGEFSVSGTTITVKKLDGTTTAATYTLDSSTAPTSRTRAT